MHIAEGYLPLLHCVGWGVVSGAHVMAGTRAAAPWRVPTATQPREPVSALGPRAAYASAIAFGLLLTSLKMPSLAGSSSHPTGMALGTALLGPRRMAPVAMGILLLQALLLAHGGLTTLGANAWSLGVVCPWVTWGVWTLLRRLSLADGLALGIATALGDLATYAATAGQLALAQQANGVALADAWLPILGVFAVTQVPIAIAEGVLTTLAWRALAPQRHPAPALGNA
ncbi:energy-coupling factor ABC transporter permease [Gemmatimonas sp.]|uniref:energy-coupling factor ABC transporter permease n=1 Tax=Gemmatimonas sp. TaxID=1962908 RepID=UPI0025BB0AA5|nr:energy-coupling factor ABC transporter permease [Gemmatimonas sp.]MCA2995818.1 energy-coupling factor ABC transporter permease [Gemmatimonas sp.]